MQTKGHVCVIGAGIIGATTAYALSKEGWSVTVIDSDSAAGMQASYANGAQLSYAYTEALANPALLRHLPTLALGQDPAFRLKPALDLDYLVGLRTCDFGRHRIGWKYLLDAGSKHLADTGRVLAYDADRHTYASDPPTLSWRDTTGGETRITKGRK